jgi:peptidoglycan/xylan/chitin deacetylase (PgdA/CDA1 family)
MNQFEKQLKYFKKNYSSVSKFDLINLINGNWKNSKPGLIISFDDGLESNYKYAKPLLEKYNFFGWFFIPAGLIGQEYCKDADNTGGNDEKYMNWEQVQDLAQNHIVGSHTLNHKRLRETLNDNILRKEIIDSRILLENKLNKKIDVFAWVGGEQESYSYQASKIIKESNYKYSFLTNHYPIKPGNDPLQLERTNIEADWPIHLVKFYTSFFMDLKYYNKRKKVKNILSGLKNDFS